MKKLLLVSSCLMLSYTYSQAQIIVYCEAPTALVGNKAFTITDVAGGWTSMPDMNLSINSVLDTLMIVDDGTAGDSLGCSPLINDLTGKIAILYRGSCEFGVKAKNAQDAGAVGVIIVNHSGAPVGMGPGAQGANVSIPTVMVSTSEGAALFASVKAGVPTVVFIGNKFGLYPNDLGFYALDALTSKVTANPKLVSASATEFNIPMGAWVHNYGNQPQTNVTLSAAISGAATLTLTSTPVANLNALGDSAYVTIPTYSVTPYSGLYEINYNVNYGNTDAFPSDNSFYSNVLVDSLFSYTLFDAATKMPKNGVWLGIYSAPFPAEYLSCVHFKDANASRIAATGMYVAAGTNITLDLTGETVDVLAYEWNNTFTDLNDPAFPATAAQWNLNEIGIGSYTYPSNLQGQMVYQPFMVGATPTPVALVDNQRYLFCSRTYNSANVQLGFDNHFNYEEVMLGSTGTLQPISVVIMDTTHYALGFGNDAVSSNTVKFKSSGLSVNEHDNSFDVTPYPNPTTEFIKIPLKGMNGTAQLNIMDLNGKVVSTQTVKVAGDVTVNVKGISNGNYVFNMLFEDGRNTTFKVVITK